MSSETKVFLFWFALLVTCAAMIVGSELVGTRVRGAMLEVGQRGFILVLLASSAHFLPSGAAVAARLRPPKDRQPSNLP
jgi:hypothetical protein